MHLSYLHLPLPLPPPYSLYLQPGLILPSSFFFLFFLQFHNWFCEQKETADTLSHQVLINPQTFSHLELQNWRKLERKEVSQETDYRHERCLLTRVLLQQSHTKVSHTQVPLGKTNQKQTTAGTTSTNCLYLPQSTSNWEKIHKY